jgi:hypothetical protein
MVLEHRYQGGREIHMKKLILGLLVSFMGLTGYDYAQDLRMVGEHPLCSFTDPLQKCFTEKSYHPRGHRGHRGHRGYAGYQGPQGLSSIFNRVSLPAPFFETPIVFGESLPYVVPMTTRDFFTPGYDTLNNWFVVPEDGVYKISYFMRAIGAGVVQNVLTDPLGVVVGIVINEELAKPIGIRKIPLVSSSLVLDGMVWGTHQIFRRLNQFDKVQFVVFEIPSAGSDGRAMQFIQLGGMQDEQAYFSITKVGN